MRLSKFERKRLELLKKHEDEIRALEQAEKDEREKMIEPVIEKISKVAAEEARKLLEKSPDLLEGFSFRKREAARFLSKAIEEFVGSEAAEEEKIEITPDRKGTEKPRTQADHPREKSDSNIDQAGE